MAIHNSQATQQPGAFQYLTQLAPVPCQVSRGEVDKLLDRVDVNNDGHVEFGELASALVDWRQARRLNCVRARVTRVLLWVGELAPGRVQCEPTGPISFLPVTTIPYGVLGFQ